MPLPSDHDDRCRERFRAYTRTLDCVHCGLCLPDCPTYGVTGREAGSPRGRVALLRSWSEGQIDLTDAARLHLDQCIVCRACETSCPSGIRMSEMMEGLREHLESQRTGSGIWHRLARLSLRHVLPYRRRVGWITDLLWLAQVSGLRRATRPLLRRFAPRLASMERLQPSLESPRRRRELRTTRRSGGGVYPASGPARLRVALFLGCITSHWFARTHRATIRVLQKNGCEVVIPEEQTCCGALHRHAGLIEDAEDLFRRNQEAFVDCGADVVVVNAAGCGASLKEPPEAIADGIGVPVRDVCELLDEIGIIEPVGRVVQRVVYDAPCHLLHAQRVESDVVEGLLRRIPGLELVDLPGSDRCCGSGGVYNLVHPEIAEPLAEEKAAAIREADPDIVVTGNPGCAIQILSVLADTSIEVLHPVELLDRAYGQ